MEADITAFVDIPHIGELKIGEFKGNLKTGIEINVGIRIVSGTFRLYLDGGYVWLQYNVVCLSKVEKGAYELFELP